MTLELRLILAWLTVFRAARFIAIDDGPLFVCSELRAWAGRKAAAGNWLWLNIADLLNCPHCLGIWLAALGLIAVVYPTIAGDLVLVWLALAGAQSFLQSVAGK